MDVAGSNLGRELVAFQFGSRRNGVEFNSCEYSKPQTGLAYTLTLPYLSQAAYCGLAFG